jgi:hypothetical protein
MTRCPTPPVCPVRLVSLDTTNRRTPAKPANRTETGRKPAGKPAQALTEFFKPDGGNDMSAITTLKRMVGITGGAAEAAATALEAKNLELQAAISEFSAAEADYGDRLLAADTDAKARAVQEDLESKRRLVERLTRARDQLADRLRSAQDAARAEESAKAWDVLAARLRERDEALAKLEAAFRLAGAAAVAAEQKAREAFDALPADRTGGDSLRPVFADLDGECRRLLSRATDGRCGGLSGTLLWDERQRESLSERAAKESAYWLSLRPDHLVPDEPEAA